jgi:hypothetical protein
MHGGAAQSALTPLLVSQDQGKIPRDLALLLRDKGHEPWRIFFGCISINLKAFRFVFMIHLILLCSSIHSSL